MTPAEIFSLLFYIAIFLLSATLLYLGKSYHKKYLLVLALMLPISLAGFRYQVGTDWAAYHQFYQEVGEEAPSEVVRQIRDRESEPLMIVLGRSVALIGTGSWVIFYFYAIITIGFMYLVIKDDKNSALLYALFLVMVFPSSFNTMRQMAAMSVMTLLLVLAFRPPNLSRAKSVALKLALALLAVNLHYASLALLPVLLVPHLVKRLGWRKLSLVLIIILIATVSLAPLGIEGLARSGLLSKKHFGALMDHAGSMMNYHFWIYLIGAGVAGALAGWKKNRQMALLIPIMLVASVYAALGFYSGYLGRIADFFWPIAIYMGWNTLKILPMRPKTQVATALVVAVVYFVLVYGWMGTNEILPYRMIFYY